MADSWINHLVVQGPAQDVRAFATAATDPRILRRQGRTPWEGSRRLGLSFLNLLRRLPGRHPSKEVPEPEEPWDLAVDPEDRVTPGMVRRVYRFQLSHYEPDDLLRMVSTQYPRLCFVLGWVAPSTDDQASRFIHRGDSLRYKLSGKRKNALPPAEDADLWELDEADWNMMDAVIERWDRKTAAALKRIAASVPRRNATAKGYRRQRGGRHARTR